VFHTLSAGVTEEMGREVLSGDLFVFLSKDRKRAKVSSGSSKASLKKPTKSMSSSGASSW
jgi:hypothetical protein